LRKAKLHFLKSAIFLYKKTTC